MGTFWNVQLVQHRSKVTVHQRRNVRVGLRRWMKGGVVAKFYGTSWFLKCYERGSSVGRDVLEVELKGAPLVAERPTVPLPEIKVRVVPGHDEWQGDQAELVQVPG
ncbi:hypothetical protein MRX96_037279 [Rhipicephalus microplus]